MAPQLSVIRNSKWQQKVNYNKLKFLVKESTNIATIFWSQKLKQRYTFCAESIGKVFYVSIAVRTSEFTKKVPPGTSLALLYVDRVKLKCVVNYRNQQNAIAWGLGKMQINDFNPLGSRRWRLKMTNDLIHSSIPLIFFLFWKIRE